MILEKLYQGELRPGEQYRPRLKETCEKRKALIMQKEGLLSKCEECIRMELLEILDEMNLLGFEQMEDAYIQGMRAGAKLAMELFSEE